MRHVVNSRELTVDASAKVEEVEILVNSDRAPMRNIDVSRGFSERWQWVWECEEQLETHTFAAAVWTSEVSFCGCDRTKDSI